MKANSEQEQMSNMVDSTQKHKTHSVAQPTSSSKRRVSHGSTSAAQSAEDRVTGLGDYGCDGKRRAAPSVCGVHVRSFCNEHLKQRVARGDEELTDHSRVIK